MNGMPRIIVALGAIATVAFATPAAESVPLADPGEELQARYAEMLTALQAEIGKALPAIDAGETAAFLKAYQDEAAAAAAELKALRSQDGKPDTDPSKKDLEAARETLALAVQKALAPSRAVLADLGAFLADGALDARLARCLVLIAATPRGLAELARQGQEQEALVDRLLADDDLLVQMAIAGGASGGRYGQAMEIYQEIQKASSRAREGLFQRLALAVSLEHAVPIAQSNAKERTGAPAVVDPVKRYRHFEKAFLDGELDPAFKDLTVWEYRMVVNGDEPDDILAWGRGMLRNYRPDEIRTRDDRWRYVKAVKTDVKYGSQDVKNDLPSLHPYQNMIKNGGVCGRRAFFGRFILRCFGIPTVRRPQRGHAALAHWTREGWVVNLGAGWEWGWTDFGEGVDFAAYTQARANEPAFLQALRARWIGEVLGEKSAFGFHAQPSGFWNGVALYRQRSIIEEAKAKTLEAVGQDIAEANVSKEAEAVESVEVTDADRRVVLGKDGVITVPAVACTHPKADTPKIVFMKSYLGGMQLHYNRLGTAETFEYSVDAPAAGNYELTARVVTVNSDIHLLVTPNDAGEPLDIAVPYTIGEWRTTPPVEVALKEGPNSLRFTLREPNHGLTIKDFVLTPVR